MAGKNSSGQSFLNLFNLGSTEENKVAVKRARELRDIEQMTTKRTTVDPAAGRHTVSEAPPALFAPSGHLVSSLADGVAGECVFCRAQEEDAGTPERVTIVSREQAGGGTCRGCGSVCCLEHGRPDEEGRFYCDNCRGEHKVRRLTAAILSLFSRKRCETEGSADE